MRQVFSLSRYFWFVPPCTAAPASAQPGIEARSLEASSYRVKVLANGRVNVSLSTGEPAFTGAFPMVRFAGEEQPRPLIIDGGQCSRIEANDRLGRAKGLLLKKAECEWVVTSYDSQPFFTVRAVYINTSDKPVKVKSLLPWCTGAPGDGALALGKDSDQAVFLENDRGFPSAKRIPTIESGSVLSMNSVAGYNPRSQRSLIAGFLMSTSSIPQVRVERDASGPAAIRVFRAECVYDPPVEVAPGVRLESDPFDPAVSESNPLEGLERFGQTTARMCERTINKRRVIPHSWDSWNTRYQNDPTEKGMLATLDFVDKNLKRYGWTHFAIDGGWSISRGDWEPKPDKFPHGMKWFVDQVHARGMTAGLWISPFRLDANSSIAKQHPEWLADPNPLARVIVGRGNRILDVTAPGAFEFVKGTLAKLTKEWGFDAVKADFTYYLLFMDRWHDSRLTRADVMRMGMRHPRRNER